MPQGGKPFYEREKAGNLRNKALDDVALVLSDKKVDIKKVEKWSRYRKEMLMKLATNLLPRLNEHMGQDGEVIKLDSVTIKIQK